MRTASIPTGVGQAVRSGVRLLIFSGSAMAEGMVRFPMPTLAAREPEDVAAAVKELELEPADS